MSWGLADLYGPSEGETAEEELDDVEGDDWRNILVWGRATKDGVYPETLALVGRARHLADELGCRVEVLLIGSALEAATKALSSYSIDRVYCVDGPDYAPIETSARVIEQVVRRRRPELIMVFQSRTGDAVTAYVASRLGVGYVLGATQVMVDTANRRTVVTHQAANEGFQMTTQMLHQPQFVSVQRGLFRAPMEEPYANVRVHRLDVPIERADVVEVVEQRPLPEAGIETAERVVVAGMRVKDKEALEAVRQLALRLNARFGVARSLVERGLSTDPVIGGLETHIAPRLLVTVGVQGSLDFLQGIEGDPTICALASTKDDPIADRAAYLVPGTVTEAVAVVMKALE